MASIRFGELALEGPKNVPVGSSEVCFQTVGPCSGVATVYVSTPSEDQTAVFVYGFARGKALTQYTQFNHVRAPKGNRIPTDVIEVDGHSLKLKNTYDVPANPTISANISVQYNGAAPAHP